MPSDKKRINLTIPDELYVRLQAYKNEQGISSDASACLQLIVQQLNGLEQSKAMLRLINNCSVEQLNKLSMEGLTLTKSVLEKEQKKEQPPKLYDLTTLQREANRLFGYKAARVNSRASAAEVLRHSLVANAASSRETPCVVCL